MGYVYGIPICTLLWMKGQGKRRGEEGEREKEREVESVERLSWRVSFVMEEAEILFCKGGD